MEFIDFSIAKQLKEKGFTCKPFAMYDKNGELYDLCTSADYYISSSGCKYNYRCYYDYEDFGENDYIAPTISQALKWLREKQFIIVPVPQFFDSVGNCVSWNCDVWAGDNYWECCQDKKSYEEAVVAGIIYSLENLF
jgi:hypothetical protein